MKRVGVIGSGFAGLSSASFLAKAGFDVTILEKNDSPGGRARQFQVQGFTFDMGPSWYWMPDVFDDFFNAFGQLTSEHYTLKRLDPSYRIYFGKDNILDVPAGLQKLERMFEDLEPGSGKHLRKFLAEGKSKYDIAMHNLVYKPGLSMRELLCFELIRDAAKLHLFKSMSKYVRLFFKEPKLIQLLEFPILFLGATAEKTPSLYSLMNYADMALGTWYPIGGMHKIVEAMVNVAGRQGVKIELNTTVQQLSIAGAHANGLLVQDTVRPFDYIVAGADYHHVDQHLIPEPYRQYSSAYWDSRVLAPSALIFFLGVHKRLTGLLHHTLFFDEDFAQHAAAIYSDPRWPSAPHFYVSCPSKSDETVAPPGCENLFILIPVAAGLADNSEIRERYYDLVLNRLESLTGQTIRESVVYKRSYAHRDFISEYNAFKGNAYGLANTLRQTAIFKPSIVNKKVANVFYTGQLTVPGPGVPPSIISGQVVARELIRRHQLKMNV